jgi:NIMA (never in mitosis gene a)-related kinase 2
VPLEEVKNLLSPVVTAGPSVLSSPDDDSPPSKRRSPSPFPAIATPLQRQSNTVYDAQPSAMKGVILTATGEALNTPKPAELASLFGKSPKVGLNFTKIFDPEIRSGSSGEETESGDEDADSPPPSPSVRKQRSRRGSTSQKSNSSSDPPSSSEPSNYTVPPTRIRRPSIRSSASRRTPATTKTEAVSFPKSTSEPAGLSLSSPATQQPKPLPHPHLHTKRTNTAPAAVYDLHDEENLPSPFIKRVSDRNPAQPGTKTLAKRPSTGNQLRALAAANSSAKKTSTGTIARPSVTSARKAGDEARKALARP